MPGQIRTTVGAGELEREKQIWIFRENSVPLLFGFAVWLVPLCGFSLDTGGHYSYMTPNEIQVNCSGKIKTML